MLKRLAPARRYFIWRRLLDQVWPSWPGTIPVNNPEEGSHLATTLERVQAIAVERLGVDSDQVVESAEFIGDLNADSLDLVEVIMAMEQEFGVEIADEDAENIRTVGDAVKYIDEHAQS
jgi:acyl carrier protein